MSRPNRPTKRSERFAEVRGYFKAGLWNADRVRDAVAKGVITEQEYDLIVRSRGRVAGGQKDVFTIN